MTESLKIPGRRLEPPPDANATSAFGVSTKVKRMVAVMPPVRGGAEEYQTLTDLDPDALMELSFPGDVKRWVSASQLNDELAANGMRGEGGVLELPPTFGASAGGIKSVAELLIEFPADFAAELGARTFVHHVEEKLTPTPGLNRIEDPRLAGVRIEDAGQVQGDRILLFIHGTVSNTLGSFGDLSGTAEWERLLKDFPGAIYALEHRTLSQSPIENAIQAATLLPAGATLNLVTHSRGGLVGELLCLETLKVAPAEIFGEGREKDRQDLQQLTELLQAKKFKVDRFVRVACPARGTLLASKRLDLYLSVLLNLIGKLPIFQGNAFYGLVEATLKKLIALKADPYELPGLEAQMPDSPLIHLLNRPDIESKADLAVIAGDSHGGAIFQALSTFAVDVFFRQKHDFVVNTSAMYGGISRSAGGYFFDDSGTAVCHFHYFKNPKTRLQMNAWLEAKSSQASGEFVKLAYRERNLIFPSLRGGNSLPKLIFIPGLLGTHLQAGEDTIWLNAAQLLPGKLDHIAYGRPVTVGAALAYQQEQFLKELNTSFDIKSFSYDWRLALHDNVLKLADCIQKELAESQNPVHLLGYASGAMIVEILTAERPELAKTLRSRGGRVAQVGDLAQAARQAETLIQGTHKLARLLQLVDRRSAAEIGEFFGEMPGVREVAAYSGAKTFVPFSAEVIRELLLGQRERPITTASVSTTKDEEDLGVPLLYPTEQDLADALFGVAAAAEAECIRIRLRAKHGHLREADYPVAVGHYLGDGIVSAERVLDRQLGGRLSENFQLDLYPGRNGTAEVFESPLSHPPGALVIGLGEVGDIGTDKVRRGVATAALRYALSRMRRTTPDGERLSLGISALLLGTYGGNALSVRDSIEAITEGVVQANHALRTQKLWDRVRIETIEFVELYEDLAIQAAHEIIKLEQRCQREAQTQPATFVANREMQTAGGGLFHRPGNPYQSGWWRRIRVEEKKDALEFTVLTDRARADFSLKPTQRKLVAACVDAAVSATHYDKDLARVLFDILLPPGIKDQIRDRTNLVFIVDRSSAHFPWEMLAQREGDTVEPLANRIGMIRQLVSKDPPKLRTSRKLAAAVVGAPFFPAPTRWPDLPEAKQEAQEVTARLQGAGYEVNTLLGDAATPLAILAGVLANNRILHLAGHGVFNKQHPERSGFVIGEDLYLSAAEITSVEPIPELVFLNCCYGGKMAQQVPGATEPHRLAGTLATTLIEMGVKAVVVSGWAVDDQAAKFFALKFYDALLGDELRAGLKFGEAVLRARMATFAEFANTNTWGAYQCYGNPDFALDVNPAKGAPRENDPTAYVARREVLERVRNIEARAVDVSDAKRAKLLTELATIDRAAAGKWDDGEMLFEIAQAYAALQSNDEAVEAFNKSFAQSKVPVRAVEQLANLLYRKAATVDDVKGHETLFEEARKRVQWTLDLHPTVERLCLMGSLYKRESVWRLKKGGTGQRDGNLQEALKWYEWACNPEQAANPEFNAYPDLNAAAIQLLLGPVNEKWKERVRRIAARSEERTLDGSVWDRTGLVDAALLLEIEAKTLGQPAVQEDLVRRYRSAFESATRRQRDSVMSQMEVMRDLLDEAKYAGEIAGLTRLIEALAIKER